MSSFLYLRRTSHIILVLSVTFRSPSLSPSLLAFLACYTLAIISIFTIPLSYWAGHAFCLKGLIHFLDTKDFLKFIKLHFHQYGLLFLVFVLLPRGFSKSSRLCVVLSDTKMEIDRPLATARI